MPLSDHEQQILEEIERQFYEQDPKGARELSNQTLEATLIRNFRRGIALFVTGFAVLGVFFFRPAPLVGVIAFLLMLAGATFAYQNFRKAALSKDASGASPLSKIVGGVEGKIRKIRRKES